jgi:hypothetical protein
MQEFVVAIIGFFGGVCGSIVAPWVHWYIEKYRMRFKRRVGLIDECKRYISNRDSFNLAEFMKTDIYSRIKVDLPQDLVKEIESMSLIKPISIKLSGRGVGIKDYKIELLDAVTKIEQKWKLL